ncbi:MAG: glycosyltransferase [Flavobacterium nitrogenifigens]|uniref:glycosyltransferase family 2 protein n=1 Tax=Flavobacterium nitrogenifigens TaxID=1617283 RepID=UPI001EF62D57|nr:glycosyltransferase [Flavobacterium nitrogenifigens]MDQ8013044.1 glycosyltransferase [Flavobacterium nitrogenifigens]
MIPYFKLSFFKFTLDSLAAQTDKRFAVYIGDDASSENPNELLEKYKGLFNFKYQYFEKNLGSDSLVMQWNRCIALTENEEWIMILGDDDILSKNVVGDFYKNIDEIKSINSSVIRFSSGRIDEFNNLTSEIFYHPKTEKPSNFYYRRHKGLTRSSLSEHIFSKKQYLQFGFRNYPLAWHSDDIAWIDFSDNNIIFNINSSIVYVRVSTLSITGQDRNVEKKKIAELFFFRDLINEKFDLFEKKQKLDFLIHYEVIIKRRQKAKLKEWFFLFKKYMQIGSLASFLQFMKRFLKYYLKLLFLNYTHSLAV